MKEKTSIAAYQGDYEKFMRLRRSRPEDKNNADTFAYLMNVSYPITDADIAELIDYAEAEDAAACIKSICDKIKARCEAPIA